SAVVVAATDVLPRWGAPVHARARVLPAPFAGRHAARPRGMSLEQEGAERRRRDARESSAMHNEGKGQMSRTRSARGAWARAAMLSLLAVLVAHAATVSACTTTADCDDGNACTTDSCDAGACAYATIADCVPCTTPAVCAHRNH